MCEHCEIRCAELNQARSVFTVQQKACQVFLSAESDFQTLAHVKLCFPKRETAWREVTNSCEGEGKATDTNVKLE